MDDDERDRRTQAMALLLGAAETRTEINALLRVGYRAGFLWMCPACKTPNYANTEACCGAPRPGTA